MTDVGTTPPSPAGRATGSDAGVDFEVTLARAELLPGQLATGAVRLAFRQEMEVRGIIATLIAPSSGNGNEPSGIARAIQRRRSRQTAMTCSGCRSSSPGRAPTPPGETREYPFELPVPPLGPATFEGTVSRLTWRLEVKLDVPGFDPSIDVDVVVLQPTALLSAGVIDVGQYALWPSADVAADGARGAIAIEPVPLCIGAPFSGLLSLATESTKLQEVRLELRQKVKATVSSGLEEEITLWTSSVAGEGELGGERAIAFDGDLPARWLPTIRLPHGRADAQFHVILAKAWAQDTHLVRDVAVCSTTEL